MSAEQTLLDSSARARVAATRRSPHRAEYTRDAPPFIAWVEERIALHNKSKERQARERGLGTGGCLGGLELLLTDIGWLDEGPRKRLWRWRNGKPGAGAYIDESSGALMVPAEQVEAALEHADVALWEVYPDEDEDGDDIDGTPLEAFCPVCSDEVTTLHGACPWCDTRLDRRPQATARGGAPKPGPVAHSSPTPARITPEETP